MNRRRRSISKRNRQRMGDHRRRLAGSDRARWVQKATPSGSKFRVPAASITGPLKSPATKIVPSVCFRTTSRCWEMVSSARVAWATRDRSVQAPHQSSGNRINGQTRSLSFAAIGGRPKMSSGKPPYSSNVLGRSVGGSTSGWTKRSFASTGSLNLNISSLPPNYRPQLGGEVRPVGLLCPGAPGTTEPL
jgi:hypothetical protein